MGLRVESLGFSYGPTPVLHELSLSIPSGDLFALLGPSGCGKSTLLHLLAGLLQPTAGRILLDDQDIGSLPPERRPIGLVFQSYALFPGMSVAENIAYGPRQRGISRAEIRERVGELSLGLGIDTLLDRHPAQLSGGQQQRVALARALAVRPALLLMDEPLSNIDPALRGQVRSQLRRLQEKWEVTTVLVTHDREDAFWLAHHMGLLREGRLVQTGTPAEIYRRPVDLPSAELLGPVNRVAAHVAKDGRLRMGHPQGHSASGARWILLRPEQLGYEAEPPGDALLMPVIVRDIVELGAERRALCAMDDGATLWAARLPRELAVGSRGYLRALEEPWSIPCPEEPAP